jgi:hypothetical protein
MTWKCGECGLEEGQNDGHDEAVVVIQLGAACHHCGKPLCNREAEEDSCRLWILDDGLPGDEGKGSPACHCRVCLEHHHPRESLIPEPEYRRLRRAEP